MTMTLGPMNFLAGREVMGFQSEGWTLAAEPPHEADRSHRVAVTFLTPFGGVPLVHLGIAGFDVCNGDAARLTATATEVTSHGFTILLSTWLNTRIWRVDVNWLAIGA